MMTPDQTRSQDDRLDDTSADSFPASDPPSHSGITGSGHPDHPPPKHRPPSRHGGDHARPTGLPDSDRHATETAHQSEDEVHPSHRHPAR